MRSLGERYACVAGYSDHTLGLDAAVLSVGVRARIIEKHFTLDKAYSEFRDHQLSADPPELAELVRRVRLAEELLGTGSNAVQPSEAGGRVAMRRSIVAAAALSAGHVLRPADITWIRPGGGLAPGQESVLLGKALRRDVEQGNRLEAGDVA